MQTKTFFALTAAVGALALAALAAPAHAGGYWDGGNPAIYGGGYCPPPPPPPCDCPPRYGYARPYGEAPPDYGYDQGPPSDYGYDEGFAPSGYDDEDADYYGPDYYGGGYVGGGPLVGVDVGLGFGGRDRRFFDERRRGFFERPRFDDHRRFDERQRFNERDHFRTQQHVFVRQHEQQHFAQQQRVMQSHQSYGRQMGGHGRW